MKEQKKNYLSKRNGGKNKTQNSQMLIITKIREVNFTREFNLYELLFDTSLSKKFQLT